MVAKTSIQLCSSSKVALVVSAALVMLTNNSFAETEHPGDAGSVLQRYQDKPQELNNQSNLRVDMPAKPRMSETKGLSVDVKSFKIVGNSLFPEQDLQVLLLDKIGQTLDFAGLQEAAEVLAAYYHEQGYFLTQAYLPEQEIGQGQVEIVLLEGRVGQVTLERDTSARLKQERAEGILNAAIQPGMPISEKNMERGLLLLNDTPGAKVHSTLMPGSNVGEADLLVKLSDTGRKVTGSVDLDNWGSRFTGRYRLGGNLNLNNLTGYGDLLTVKASLSHDSGIDKGVRLGRVSYSFPLTASGLKVGASYSRLGYQLGKEFDYLGVDGEAEIMTASAIYPFIRSRNLNLIGLASFDHKQTYDQNESVNVNSNKQVRLFNTSLSGDFSGRLLGDSLNSFMVTASYGDVDIQDARSLQIDQSNSGYKTNGHFFKLNGNMSRLQALPNNLSVLVSGSGQWASKALASSEQFYLGGPDAVRAYPIGEGLSDEGIVASSELRWSKPDSKFMLNGFVDFGYARLHKEPLVVDVTNKVSNTRTLLGYGVGMSVADKDNYLLRTSVAWRSSRNDCEPRSDSNSSNPQLWVQLSKWF